MGQIHNGTGTCKFLSLHTGKPFTANHFTVLPITDVVVEYLNNMAKKDRTPTRELIFRLHGVDLSDESPIPELKIKPFPDPTIPGTPITFTTDEADEEDFPTLLSSPTTNEESPDQRIDRPIRGVEARSEDIQYLRSSEDGANDHGDQEINDNDINPKIPEIIDDSDDVDEITPLQQLPDEPAAYKRPIRTKRAPERLMHRRHVHGQRTPPVTVYVDDLMILM